MSQAVLGKKLGYAQENGQFISNIERGLSSIPPYKFDALSCILGINREAIIEACVKDFRDSLQ